jgi:hypothetical protein
MVRRSNEISREICRAKDADDGPLPTSSVGHCSINGPGPSAKYRRPNGNELGDTGNHRMRRPDRRQSSRSSDEAAQHNAVEQRGTGRKNVK